MNLIHSMCCRITLRESLPYFPKASVLYSLDLVHKDIAALTIPWHIKLSVVWMNAFDVLPRASLSIELQIGYTFSCLSVEQTYKLATISHAHLPDVPHHPHPHPQTFPLNIGLNILPSDSFMSGLDSLLRFSTGEYQALRLIIIAVFCACINHLPPVCWSAFWKSSLKWYLVCENNFSLFSIMFYIYHNASHYDYT